MLHQEAALKEILWEVRPVADSLAGDTLNHPLANRGLSEKPFRVSALAPCSGHG